MRDETAADDPGARGMPGWLQVARETFRHHLRGPWFVALCLVGLLSPLVGLLWIAFASSGSVASRDVLPPMTAVWGATLPVLLLLLVVPGFRGAWLRDPSAAGERIGGYFAGTWAALAAAFAPWALVSFAGAAWADSAWPALLATLLHGASLALLAGAWLAVWLLVVALFRREEARWVGAAMTLVVLTVVLPFLGQQATFLWQRANDPLGGAAPAWAYAFHLLSPGTLQDLLVSSLAGKSYDPFADGLRAAAPSLFNPLTFLVALALWILVPLALAVRMQRRAEDPMSPLEMPL